MLRPECSTEVKAASKLLHRKDLREMKSGSRLWMGFCVEVWTSSTLSRTYASYSSHLSTRAVGAVHIHVPFLVWTFAVYEEPLCKSIVLNLATVGVGCRIIYWAGSDGVGKSYSCITKNKTRLQLL